MDDINLNFLPPPCVSNLLSLSSQLCFSNIKKHQSDGNSEKALRKIMAYEKSTEKRGNLLAGGFLQTLSLNKLFFSEFILSLLIKFPEIFLSQRVGKHHSNSLNTFVSHTSFHFPLTPQKPQQRR